MKNIFVTKNVNKVGRKAKCEDAAGNLQSCSFLIVARFRQQKSVT
jgi:hypothetical protein